jgi:hypothetical protein
MLKLWAIPLRNYFGTKKIYTYSIVLYVRRLTILIRCVCFENSTVMTIPKNKEIFCSVWLIFNIREKDYLILFRN